MSDTFCPLVEPFVRDVILTREELLGLEQELLCSDAKPLGQESTTEWLRLNGGNLGKVYENDVNRHFGKNRLTPI